MVTSPGLIWTENPARKSKIMEDENAGAGEGNHSQAKKTKLSDDRNRPESSTTAAVADVVEVSDEQLLQPSPPSESAVLEDAEG